MSRIVAGVYGGRRISTPPGERTRPTSERVREAMFSRLEHLDAIEGAVVLDLYAGSGALALEALSRGAVRATLVEADAAVARVARRNIAELGAPARVIRRTVLPYLSAPGERHERFDLVFADPPYAVTELQPTLAALVPHLAPGALLVLERSARTEPPDWPTGLTVLDERTYGETSVRYVGRDETQ